MAVSRQLLFFGGFLAIVILLLGIVAVVSARGPNTLKYGGPPIIEGERYVTDEFERAFSFEAIGEGWTLDGPEAPYVLALHNSGSYLDFMNIEDFMVFDPSGADRVPAPEDMLGWYQQHPYLHTEEPQPVSIAGVKGVYFDAVMTTLPEGHDLACEDPASEGMSLNLLSAPDGHVLCLTPQEKVRVILLEGVKGEPVSIMFFSDAVDFEEHLPRAQKLLETVEWKGA